jgi:hypothetical protein
MPSATEPIPRVSYPRKHLSSLKRLGPLMIGSMQRDGLPIETGQINLGKLDQKLDVAYFFFMWVSETNEIIDHLNLVILDLRSLAKTHSLLGGSPWMRYELLVRTFFHEFYRFRELLNTVLSAVAKRGHISKEELSIARAAFHGAIEQTIDLRNSMVHSDVVWRGKQHFDLNLASIVHNRGQSRVSRRTGHEFSLEDALSKACNRTSNALQYQGRTAARLTSAFIRDTVAVM